MDKNRGEVSDIIVFFVYVIVAIILFIFVLEKTEKNYNDENNNWFQQVDNYDYLVYDPETRIVYYRQKEMSGYKGFGYLAPYYSECGFLCRYVNGQIVEIENMEEIEDEKKW